MRYTNLLGTDWHRQITTKWLFWRYDYTEAYRRLMDYRVERFGPDEAVGGFDQGIGELQFEFLCEQGLSPEDRLLDLGCGSLRGGERYIQYLEPGNYCGMDISRSAIEAGVDRLGSGVIDGNDTIFVVNTDLKFDDVNGPFDYAIAQSVFTHLPLEMIEECLAHIGTVVDGDFYATFFDEPRPSPKNFGYDPETLEDIAEKYNHSSVLLPVDEYPHPRDQRMMRFSIGVE